MALQYNPLPEDARSTLYPIARPEIYQMYLDQRQMFWVAGKVPLVGDTLQWNSLTPGERHMLRELLVLFEGSDVIAAGIFGDSSSYLGPIADIPEVKVLMHYQTMMEDIHSEQYSLLTEHYFASPAELAKSRENFGNSAQIAAIMAYLRQHITPTDIGANIFIMSLFEGVLFSTAFIIIFTFDEIICLRQANEYIAKDEGKHHVTSSLLQKLVLLPSARLSTIQAHDISREMCKLMCNFFCSIVAADSLRGITQDKIQQYIKFKLDDNLVLMGYPVLFNVTNPFPKLEQGWTRASLTAPHERHPTGYSTISDKQMIIDDDAFIL
jgi:ribonucleotide reductase beta subunit family protein with ferritin-like domain